jgi:signal transduction histidine kinase
MFRFRDLPIKRKLILMNTLTSIIVLLLVSAAFGAYEVVTFRQKMTRDLEILAKIIATNSTASLMFNDKKSAADTLSALSAQQHILIACIYSSDGNEFAKYVRPSVSIACPDHPLKDGHSFGAGGFSLFQGIIFQKQRTGTIYLESDLEELHTRLKRDAGIVALVLSVASLLVFFLSSRLQRLISQPILHLVQTARSVSNNKDYSVRAEKSSQDESGLLIDTFNEMLTQIHERDKELTRKNTDLEDTLQKLQKAQQTLVTQEKMASLGSLTAGLAHEIRNPLNFVTNFAALSVEQARELRDVLSEVRDKLGQNIEQDVSEILDDIQSNSSKIKEHGDRANSIITGMLLHSRGVPGQREPVDLNKLLDEYVDLSYHGMRAKDTRFNITIERDYDPALGTVQIIPQDMSRVFLNLINNACYAADEKKKTSGEEFSPTVRVSTKNLDRTVEVRVRDNGNGIPAESLHKVFEPFFTTKPTGEGTGLGLSISYEIVVGTHHGEIRVESEEGRFAEFIVVLPKV